MKKLSNSAHSSPTSSSSSSSSTTNFDPKTMCHPKNSNAGCCFSAILRRMLCSGGLPTHPSDQIRDLDSNSIVGSGKDQNFKTKKHNPKNTSTSSISTSTISTTTPNIVARLMGLDSMVEVPLNSLSRSKSMNSVDCLGEFNRLDGLHKRANSTLSFREGPTFLLLENDNFFVLSFETDEAKESKFKSRFGRKTREMGFGELRQRERREKKGCDGDEMKGKKLSKNCGSVGNGGNLRDITNTCSVSSSSSTSEKKKKKCFDSEARRLLSPSKYQRESVAGEQMKRRRRKKKTSCRNENKVEIECKSEQDSSPVSVLDFERDACGTG